MKRVIRSYSSIEGAGIVDMYKKLKKSLSNYFNQLRLDIELEASKKDGTEIWKVIMEDGRYLHVSIRPVEGEPGYFSLHYRTDDGVIQDKRDIGIKEGKIDDAILDALNKFYDWDSYEDVKRDETSESF